MRKRAPHRISNGAAGRCPIGTALRDDCRKFGVASCGLINYTLPSLVRSARPPRALGAVAQLGERLHGMQEVTGSIPVSSTTISAT
jgi:hypothetical protein